MTAKDAQRDFVDRLDRHRNILYKIANAYCREAGDREDLIQEIVVQLWRSFPRFDDRAAFSTWMYRVAVNVAVSFKRTRMRASRHIAPAHESVLEALPALEEAERDERHRLLRELIDGLEPLDRALTILYLDGYSHSEIAAIFGISQSNVGTKLGRIKARLKRSATAGAHN
jgi:RNA polymerase sigma factor (sigma-70 family)